MEARLGSPGHPAAPQVKSRTRLFLLRGTPRPPQASAYGSDDKNQLKLCSHWRSSCSVRVRIALNLKGLNYEYRAVNLLKGAQFSAEFTKLNPLGYVPVLMDGDIILADSFAIIMYLEEKYPQHSLLPKDLQKRGINYQAANIVSSSIQPFQNLGTLKYIKEKVGPNEDLAWAKYHIEKGFVALEKLLKDYAGRYATGDEVFLNQTATFVTAKHFFEPTPQSLGLYLENGTSPKPCIQREEGTQLNEKRQADLFLAPQLHGASKQFKIDMAEFPLLCRLNEAYNETPAFQDAMPENQPDAPPASTS
ncbi:Glutathione S-transferase zeta class [Morella rubra]|uniref:glutathione transferase n=1 Tax=Morella rubra TaxID=262757 RepID=A0A6A1UQH3_9ROSI|nr:Glutathione S-transferase zeta class [Morella rubra]